MGAADEAPPERALRDPDERDPLDWDPLDRDSEERDSELRPLPVRPPLLRPFVDREPLRLERGARPAVSSERLAGAGVT